MIEGQEDVTWEDWVALAEACECSGIETLFRSDHYLSVVGRHGRGSLDAWGTISALAAITSALRLGTLVSPVTFRHPSVLAKAAVTADHISGGERIELGIGAGWLEDEHSAYGFPFPATGERMQMLVEQVEIVRREWSERDLTFDGEHYRLDDLDALPKPLRSPNLIVGGKARPRTVSIAVRWADEYNLSMVGIEECRERRRDLIEACERAGREPLTVSLMTGSLIGADEADLADRARRLAELRGEEARDTDAFIAALPDHWIVGTLEQVRERVAELEEAGVERVMLQHLLHRDLEGVALLAELARA
ncbi:MAG TPA: LLM class flavin-dependent oxidoreductase [Solirubrobacterales bacterium]|nr:LLM class flavin-dependent oxidoreductase [Solirubrobacterales bacterium]